MATRFDLLTAGESSPKVRKVHDACAAILYLAPYTLGSPRPRNGEVRLSVCPASTVACRKDCLYHGGRGRFTAVQDARIRRTRLLFSDPVQFHERLDADLLRLQRQARKLGLPPVCRLNGTSDLDWREVYRRHPDVLFWEYTKVVDRVTLTLADQRHHATSAWPRNASLCYSRNEVAGDAVALDLQRRGAVVVVVFSTPRGAALPSHWYGLPVTDGDVTDARYLDPAGTVVGLRAKGPARKDTSSGFVVQVNAPPCLPINVSRIL